MTASRPTPLSEEETTRLLIAVLDAAPLAQPLDDEELDRIFMWAQEARVAATLLDGVLSGRIAVRWFGGDDEPKFDTRRGVERGE